MTHIFNRKTIQQDQLNNIQEMNQTMLIIKTLNQKHVINHQTLRPTDEIFGQLWNSKPSFQPHRESDVRAAKSLWPHEWACVPVVATEILWSMPAARIQNPKHTCELQTLQSRPCTNESPRPNLITVQANRKWRRMIIMMMLKWGSLESYL